jgi:hypothetical protein
MTVLIIATTGTVIVSRASVRKDRLSSRIIHDRLWPMLSYVEYNNRGWRGVGKWWLFVIIPLHHVPPHRIPL